MRTTAIATATAFALLLGVAARPAAQAPRPKDGTRIKDVTSLQGLYSVPLIGYGLVVGLNKTGDKKQTIFPAQTLANMLERFGVSVPGGQIKIENIAAVIVTSELPQYARTGTRLDVTASSIGDARSLQGGVLLPTPLRGPDGQVRVTAQGSLSLGGFGGGGGSNSVVVNHLTVGRVPGGGLVESNAAVATAASDSISFALKDPDFMSASHVTQAINAELGDGAAHTLDSATIVVRVPAEYRDSVPALIARLEPLSVDVDAVARVVINERTGTVVVGGAVRLGPAAVAHGNLSVRITTKLEASQPLPLSQGATVLVPKETVDVQEGRAKLVTLEQGTTLEAVVRALNALGASPRDIIAIMQGLKAAGALQADLVIL
jgi:flagellar P-ring protein precursor FlgI